MVRLTGPSTLRGGGFVCFMNFARFAPTEMMQLEATEGIRRMS